MPNLKCTCHQAYYNNIGSKINCAYTYIYDICYKIIYTLWTNLRFILDIYRQTITAKKWLEKKKSFNQLSWHCRLSHISGSIDRVH